MLSVTRDVSTCGNARAFVKYLLISSGLRAGLVNHRSSTCPSSPPPPLLRQSIWRSSIISLRSDGRHTTQSCTLCAGTTATLHPIVYRNNISRRLSAVLSSFATPVPYISLSIVVSVYDPRPLMYTH